MSAVNKELVRRHFEEIGLRRGGLARALEPDRGGRKR
jgi:hypothetical protein